MYYSGFSFGDSFGNSFDDFNFKRNCLKYSDEDTIGKYVRYVKDNDIYNDSHEDIWFDSCNGKTISLPYGMRPTNRTKIISAKTGEEVKLFDEASNTDTDTVGICSYFPDKTLIMTNPDITVAEEKPVSLNTTKSDIKKQAKQSVKRKYRVGDILILKGGIRDGSEQIVKKFIVKQVIWTLKDKITNILILKQIDGFNRNKYTLNKTDCKRYHIKYEPGLVVYPMELNFTKVKK